MAGDKKNPPVNWRGSVGVDLSLSGEDAFRIYVGVLFTYSGLGQGADRPPAAAPVSAPAAVATSHPAATTGPTARPSLGVLGSPQGCPSPASGGLH